MTKIWFISDSHTRHGLLAPKKCDIVVHCGDFSNSISLLTNIKETFEFIEWYKELPIETKILSCGNHDIASEKQTDIFKQICKDADIHLLLHDEKEIDGIRFFGSPYTPSFSNGWAWNVKRHKIHEYWKQIPDDTEFLITHGMPKGYGDLTDDRDTGNPIQVGCKALLNRIDQLPDLKVIAGGHIHDGHTKKGSYNNSGVYIRNRKLIVNASCVTDRQPSLTSTGHIINYNPKTKRVSFTV